MAAAVPITTAPMNAVSRKEVRWDGDMKLMLRHDTIGRVVRLTPWSESAASMIHWGLNGVGWLAGQPANLTDEAQTQPSAPRRDSDQEVGGSNPSGLGLSRRKAASYPCENGGGTAPHMLRALRV